MGDDSTIDARERARTWALALLDDTPWPETRTRAALLLAGPPVASWVTPAHIEGGQPSAWLVVDRIDVRALPPAQREPLAKDGVYLQSTPRGELVAIVFEALELVLDGVGRRSLEARWTLAHAEALHDPLHRHEQLRRAAAVLPRDGEERAFRPLYVQLAEAIRGLGTGTLPAAGEAAAAACRLVGVLEEGMHAPVEWLASDAAETDLGRRLRIWLDDLAAAAHGDDGARRRALAAGDGVLRTFAEPIRQRIGQTPWLTSPLAYAMRPPR
ncbi:MAG: hypothetical protein IT299_11720 [Dehalococcoidia bacterium]|nr:hypothetical protein [Dehalococcoidia bacterium]